MPTTNKTVPEALTKIARRYLILQKLESRDTDGRECYGFPVDEVCKALLAAYRAGRASAK